MKKLFAIILSLLLAACLYAQNSIRVQAPNLVAADEQFNVTFIIEGEKSASDFQWNPGNDFQLVWGPQKGSSTSISIVNGKRTTSAQSSYTYVLAPKSVGKFQLAPASATIGREKLVSRPVEIEVVSNGQTSAGSQTEEKQGAQTSRPQASSGDIFMRLTFSKTRAVVGETITATLKLYQRANIAGFEDARFPTFNGFWSQELSAPSNIEFQRENVGDMIYNSAVLRSWKLIPQQAGEITIDPAELVCLVNVRTQRASTGSIFDSFFQDEYQTIRKRVSTQAVKMKISPLPAGAPSSFGGGVGQFSLKASVTRDSLKTHDAASLIVKISGKGNISMLEAPRISFPPDFEVYDVKTSDDSSFRTFEYPFIPRSAGEFTLGPVEYSYYDISAGKYVTLKSAPLEIKVARSSEPQAVSESGRIVPGVLRKDVRDLGRDIRFIKTEMPAFAPVGYFFMGSSAYWLVLIAILVISAAVWLSFRKVAARRADVAGNRNRAATKMARKRLSRASEYLKGNLHTAFYEELHKTLLGFVSDKLLMDATEMSRENIKTRLVASGVEEPVVDEFTKLIEACEFARYAPDAGSEAMSAHFETAVRVISIIDEKMKGKKIKVSGTLSALALCLALSGLTLSGNLNAAEYDRDSLWNNGVAAYSSGQWEAAVSEWKAIEAGGLESAELYYNMAGAYCKMMDYGHSILYYERALKLDPSNKDIRYNLEYVNTLVQDQIEVVPEFFLTTWGRNLCWSVSSDLWAVLSLVFLALSCCLFLLFLLGRSSSARKAGFFISIATLLLTVFCIIFSVWQKRDCLDKSFGVITKAVTSAKSSPDSNSSTDLFVLHEGTKVEALEEIGAWTSIELSDGRKGWIKNSDFERI